MASRPVWEGHLRLSLVACPVRLFKATGEGDAVHFHLLHRQTLNRVKQQYRDPEDGVTASSNAATWSRATKSSATATWWSTTTS
jgi:DNA end-binding protein Ku